jgi:hypothetical protein
MNEERGNILQQAKNASLKTGQHLLANPLHDNNPAR